VAPKSNGAAVTLKRYVSIAIPLVITISVITLLLVATRPKSVPAPQKRMPVRPDVVWPSSKPSETPSVQPRVSQPPKTATAVRPEKAVPLTPESSPILVLDEYNARRIAAGFLPIYFGGETVPGGVVVPEGVKYIQIPRRFTADRECGKEKIGYPCVVLVGEHWFGLDSCWKRVDRVGATHLPYTHLVVDATCNEDRVYFAR